MKAGLFFGSFNPLHIGHMAIANYMAEFTDMDELWFVVSPQNPFKKRAPLLADHLRLEMVEIAIKGDDSFRMCDVEFRMPKPSYTIDTLMYLKERHKKTDFVLIMGSDNLEHFNKWKNYDMIEKHFERYIYPRPGTHEKYYKALINARVVDAPLMEVSSSFIRDAIKEGKNIRYFLPEKVYDFIDIMNLYKK